MKGNLMVSFLQLIFRPELLFKSITTDCSSLPYLYKKPDRDVNIKSRHTKLELPVAIKISLLPAALSIMKTQMPVDPKKKKPFCFRVTYSFLLFPVWTYGICSTVPAAKYLAKGLHSDDHCSAKKITEVFNGTNYWEQETVEKKK